MDDTEKSIVERMFAATKVLADSVPINYQLMLFVDPLEDTPLHYCGVRHITDLCADLGKYEVLHPSEITNEWLETSLYYTCDLLKKHKNTLWDLLNAVTMHADDFWSVSHKFITLCGESEPETSDKFEFLRQSESRSKCTDGKTLYEFMTEVVPSASNLTGDSTQFPVECLTNRLLRHVALLQRAAYAGTREYSKDLTDLIAEKNKTYNACVRRIVKNNIWFNSFASYVDETVRDNCGLIEYSIYKEQKEKES